MSKPLELQLTVPTVRPSVVVGRRKEIARFLQQRRFPREGSITAMLNLKCLKAETGPVILGCSLNDEGPLSRNEVVELLSEAVDTLLKPENQSRLRERLEKRKQKQSRFLEQLANVDQCSSPEATNSPQNLGYERLSEMGSSAVDSARTSSDEASSFSKNATVPLTLEMTEIVEFNGQPETTEAMESSSGTLGMTELAEFDGRPETMEAMESSTGTLEMTELVEFDGQPQTIETIESSTVSIEGKDGKSLTSIRRLKVLDVHSYVHDALRQSALRSWLRSRTISE